MLYQETDIGQCR